MSEKRFRTYIGDSVYASFDGYHIWLDTDNGDGPTNVIALEPEAVEAFIGYVDRLNEARRASPEI